MDNQRAIQLLQAHIDAADMPLFSQAAAIGIRAIQRVALLEAELARQIACREDSERKLMAADDALNRTAYELAEARKDGERIDELEIRGGGWLTYCIGGYNEPPYWEWGGKKFGTLRAASDAARAAEGGKG